MSSHRPTQGDFYKTKPSDCRKIYLARKNCPYCAQSLPADFKEKKEALRRERIKETARRRRGFK